MKTLLLTTGEKDIEEAGRILRNGGLVAFPTETVYGLGANALDPAAVKAVYDAKGRPSDNPMIVHISAEDELPTVVAEVPEKAKVLMKAFWPGPLTMVFRKSEAVPMRTTGGLDTVGIRMPSSEVARALIKAAGVPIAAPSANLSGKPSPTNYKDVLEDMDGRIDAVIEGEPCAVGIESTVLDLTGEVPTILRPGYVTKEMLEDVLAERVDYDRALLEKSKGGETLRPRSPGMKYKHYSPNADVKIIAGAADKVAVKIKEIRTEAEAAGRKVAVIDYGEDSESAARGFFSELRELDRQGFDVVLVSALDEKGLGFSVMNRMVRSAGYDIIEA